VFRDYVDGEMRRDVIARVKEQLPGRPLLLPSVRSGWLVHEETIEQMRARARAELLALPPKLRELDGEEHPNPVAYSERFERRSRRSTPAPCSEAGGGSDQMIGPPNRPAATEPQANGTHALGLTHDASGLPDERPVGPGCTLARGRRATHFVRMRPVCVYGCRGRARDLGSGCPLRSEGSIAMAQATTKHRPTEKSPATPRRRATASRPTTAIDRTTELSDEVLDSVEKGQRAAIEAVRKFVDTVDEALPAHGEGPTRRQEIVDSAMEMADRLVHTQYDFIRKVIDSAGKSLSRSDGAK